MRETKTTKTAALGQVARLERELARVRERYAVERETARADLERLRCVKAELAEALEEVEELRADLTGALEEAAAERRRRVLAEESWHAATAICRRLINGEDWSKPVGGER